MPATTPPPADTHQAALDLAAHGFRVLPIKPGEKRPPMAAWQEAATTDPKTIRNWWGGLYRLCGIGIATGHLEDGTGWFALDIDDRPEVSGSDTLAELERKHGALPDTITSITGSGSGHRCFLVPPGHPVPRNDQSGKLGPGIDVRGEGGQIVVAPTIHPNGHPYAWEIGRAPGEIEMAVAPAWLMNLLAPEEAKPMPPVAPRTLDTFMLTTSPADRFNQSTTWVDILGADGWTLSHTDHAGVQYWVRPGKEPRDGTSATVGWQGNDALKVFTSSVPWLDAERTYSRFQYMAARDHHNDYQAAARAVLAVERPAVLPVVQVGQPVVIEVDRYDAALLNQLQDWPKFWTQSEPEAEWLVEPVLAVARSGAMFAPGGLGKSLFMLWMAFILATGGAGLDGRPVKRRRVLYLDYEMTGSDLMERLSAMGATADTDLSWLHYATLPVLPPADAPEGGKAIARLAQLVDAEIVIIDTFSRAVEGDENDANTVRSFYRWTGLHLKAEGRAFWRVDHAGKDAEKGQRGSSAKNDDVDVVWQLLKADGGFKLAAKKRRMGWVPEEVLLTQRDEPELHYRAAMESVPAGTAKVIADLDELGAPVEISQRKAMQLLRDAGRGAKTDAIRAALKTRKRSPFRAVDNSEKARPEVGARPDDEGAPHDLGRGGARYAKPLVDDGARFGARWGAVDRSTAPHAPPSMEGRGGETAPRDPNDAQLNQEDW
jgi:hypothetical protein